MIVRDFYPEGISFLPFKADPPLIIDPDALLPRPIASKFLRAIPRIREADLLGCAQNKLAVLFLMAAPASCNNKFLIIHRNGCFQGLYPCFRPRKDPYREQIPPGVGWKALVAILYAFRR